ncbi:MAG: S9 family peptidase [Saprospiraceae bacterium]|nr:S9 family peptidase [Saprospiraceae bacterium]
MSPKTYLNQIIIILIFQCAVILLIGQGGQGLQWSKDGNSYYSSNRSGEILRYDLPGMNPTPIVPAKDLTPANMDKPLSVNGFSFSEDGKKILVFTNSKRVWRANTRGDYWVLDLNTKQLKQIGKDMPESTLMFAKFSPDASKVAYVSQRNIYVEDLASGKVTKLTSDNGTKKLINGTFDWVYEEEFGVRDGFRWAPDGKTIAYWQIDANQIRDFYMINNTDSIYSQIIPIEYPKAGESPSPAKIGVVDIASAKTIWMNVPGDPVQHYIPRMEWMPDGKEIMIQQLNRKQNESKIMLCNPKTGVANTIFSEKDEAWVDAARGWEWVNDNKEFVWTSEQDGWRHLYLISRDGKSVKTITKGNYDVIQTTLIDDKNDIIYFMASPDNATQRYLYKIPLKENGKLEKVSPAVLEGSHSYTISPNGKYARHSFSNYYTRSMTEWITLPDHKPLNSEDDITKKFDPSAKEKSNVSFFKVTTEEGVELDGWIAKPNNFDPNKKYPVVFKVYAEPASSTVTDSYGTAGDYLYTGNMAEEGYIHISVDNRGTPSPRGREWRKSIYRKLGQINIRDQAMAAKKLLEEWKFLDPERVAVWGWSGGGSTTLNLMFQYPEIYKVGISVAPVTASYLYDNIYTERYMGLPQENKEDYDKGAALTYAKKLEGQLLLIHGTGDDNVHFQNAEMLVNELIKHQKQFTYMPYPNRTHGIREGEGTSEHLRTLVSNFLKTHCPPGGREVRP